MFIESYDSYDYSTASKAIKLNFIKSLSVSAYPCGRRRSNVLGFGEDAYYIPFDPEARLNTEANNRKHSALNGYTQTYLKNWDINETQTMSLSLGGYLFTIKLESSINTPNEFGMKVAESVGDSSIYANICIEETPLFSAHFGKYYTSVLRNQSRTAEAQASLDLLVSSASGNIDNPDNYYFSGLSFSTAPLSGNEGTRSITNVYDEIDNATLTQRVISLKILEKVNGVWQIYQPALLPEIEHGDIENSVKVGTLFADKIIQNGIDVPSLEVVKVGDKYQLQFSFGKN